MSEHDNQPVKQGAHALTTAAGVFLGIVSAVVLFFVLGCGGCLAIIRAGVANQ